MTLYRGNSTRSSLSFTKDDLQPYLTGLDAIIIMNLCVLFTFCSTTLYGKKV